MANKHKGTIGLWAAVSIGVGGMVGGGIFAVLGLAVQLARGGSPLAFALAGGVALLTAYSYAKLSVAYPSRGGTVTFLDRVFGSGMFTGSLNVLMWLSYVIMLSLYSYAFGSYGATFLPKEWHTIGKHGIIVASILGITGLNLMSADVISKVETWIVAAKVLILLVFVGAGLTIVEPSRIEPSAWSPPLHLAAGGMIIFLAYEGFQLISNAARDVKDPKRTIPRALYISVIFVIVLYVLVSLVAVGNLSVDKIVEAKDYALAEAARPLLGQTGFLLIVIAALFSTASAINATLYGAARLSYTIAREGQLPSILERNVWGKPIEGLLITSVLTLIVANAFDLTSISTMGSAGFLLIFAAVNAANARHAEKTHSNQWVSVVGAVACLVALGALLWQTATTEPAKLWVLAGLTGLAVAIEGGFRLTKREFNIKEPPADQEGTVESRDKG